MIFKINKSIFVIGGQGMRGLFLSLLFVSCFGWVNAATPSAKDLVLQSEQQTMGDSLRATITMNITREGSERSLKFKIWQSKRDKALVKIIEPRKDLDTGSLRIGMGLWQFLPNVNRVIRIPPSMMLQSWMGSDFTNDDLVKASSLSRDYIHTHEGVEKIGADEAVKILCQPKPDAPVVWGKIKLWLRKGDSVPLRQEFYSEHNELLKVMIGSDIKKVGSHTIPMTLTMTTPKKPKNKTVMRFEEASFDQVIADSIFTQEVLQRAVAVVSRD